LRQCPNCEYVDPPYWRHPAFFPDLDYVRFDDFQQICPDLAKDLKPGKTVEDKFYVYRRGPKSKWVYRIWKPIYVAFGEGGASPWSKIRKNKFYDSSGRVDKNNLSRLFKAMNQNRLPRNKLDQYLEISEALLKPDD